MDEWLFWIFLFLIIYSYFGYPLLLFVISFLRERTVHKADISPMVSMIIAVHNEEEIIKRKLENILALNYPQKKLEIIVVSDCSIDSTNQIVSQFEKQGIRLLSLGQRMGKHYAQKIGVNHARGEVLAFTDASPMLEKDSLLNMVKNYADPSVGCVTSEDRIYWEESCGSGESTYIKYEMLLRRLESKVCSVVGLSGSFFSARKELCKEFRPNYSSDFLLALDCVKYGLRAINDSSSTHCYGLVKTTTGEFERKTRTVMNGLRVLFHNLALLNLFRYGFFSIELISHKLCRWLVPFFLSFLLLTNVLILDKGSFYLSFFMTQIFFYSIAGFALIFTRLNKFKIFRILSFFCLTNSAVLVGWFRLFIGREHSLWQPSQRQ